MSPSPHPPTASTAETSASLGTLPAMPVPYEQFGFSLDLPNDIDPSDLNLITSPEFEGIFGSMAGVAAKSLGGVPSSSRSAGIEDWSASIAAASAAAPPAGPPPLPPSDISFGDNSQGKPSTSLFDASETSFLTGFLEGFEGSWDFNPTLPADMPSFADAENNFRASMSASASFPGGLGAATGVGYPDDTPSTMGASPSSRASAAAAASSSRGRSLHRSAKKGSGSTVGYPSPGDSTTLSQGRTPPALASSATATGAGDDDGEDAAGRRKRTKATSKAAVHASPLPHPPHFGAGPSSSYPYPYPHEPSPPHRAPLADVSAQSSWRRGDESMDVDAPPPRGAAKPGDKSKKARKTTGKQTSTVKSGGEKRGKAVASDSDDEEEAEDDGEQGNAGEQGDDDDDDGDDSDDDDEDGNRGGGDAKKQRGVAASSAGAPRPLLSEGEKRKNHILSEQRRRNQIREAFKELVELLDAGRAFGARGLGLSSGMGTGIEDEGLDDRDESDVGPDEDVDEAARQKRRKRRTLAATRPKGKGRGRGGSAGGGAGSKSAVLFQAVDLLRWIEGRNEALQRQCETLESATAAALAGHSHAHAMTTPMVP